MKIEIKELSTGEIEVTFFTGDQVAVYLCVLEEDQTILPEN